MKYREWEMITIKSDIIVTNSLSWKPTYSMDWLDWNVSFNNDMEYMRWQKYKIHKVSDYWYSIWEGRNIVDEMIWKSETFRFIS